MVADSSTARAILERLEFHHTPKPGLWLNMAEIEISIFERGCLTRPVGDLPILRQRAIALETARNAVHATIRWQFTSQQARAILADLYPIAYSVGRAAEAAASAWHALGPAATQPGSSRTGACAGWDRVGPRRRLLTHDVTVEIPSVLFLKGDTQNSTTVRMWLPASARITRPGLQQEHDEACKAVRIAAMQAPMPVFHATNHSVTDTTPHRRCECGNPFHRSNMFFLRPIVLPDA